MLGTHTDITEGKQSELARKALQDQLDQSQKMETVGVLAGGVAHDFNNLLQIMAGSMEMISRDNSGDHKKDRHLATLDKCIQRASQLVRQMLTFSRKASQEIRRVDLNKEIMDAYSLFERTIPKMISVELCLDDALWPINADPLQVEQVLLNLAANAADAMPHGGKLTLQTSNLDPDPQFIENHPGLDQGQYVHLNVSDTGCGMPEETLKHIFEPFFTTKETGKGTGLGLATVYGIIKSHGGHIFTTSEPGHGTSFSIFWPAVDGAHERHEMAPGKVKSTAREGAESILIVDEPGRSGIPPDWGG